MDNEMIERSVIRSLDKKGLRHSIAGYKYLVIGCSLLVGARERNFKARDLYEDIAELCGVKWAAVERAIRTIIHRSSRKDISCLSNKELISMVVDELL